MSIISLAKINVAVIVLVALYYLLMRGSKHFTANRLFLNAIPLLALLILFIPKFGTLNSFEVFLPEYIVGADLGSIENTSLGSVDLMLVTWISGMIIMLLLALIKMYRTIAAFREEDTGLGAYSFLGRIHVDPIEDQALKQQMYDHELIHVRQFHSVDLLWYECWKIIFWFNPALYFGQNLLKEQHEYLADEAMQRSNDAYPELLVAHAFGLIHLPLANEFKGTNVKNRVIMMKKTKNMIQSFKWYTGVALTACALVCLSWTNFNGLPSLDLPIQGAKGKVYEKVDKMPLFPGCQEMKLEKDEMKKCSFGKLIEYMSGEVKYPKYAEKDGTEGTVMVKFTVSADGTVRDVEVDRSVEAGLDAEALRVIESMPNWIPGEHDGQKVNVSIVLPIKFALSNDE